MQDAAATYGLEHHADLLELLARPSVRLQATPAETLSPGASRIGGAPEVAPGFQWPRTQTGAPLIFLAQLNLADLAPHDATSTLPARGLLLLFFRWGEGACGRAIFIEPNALQAADFADDLPMHERFPPFELKPHADLTLPRYGSHGSIAGDWKQFYDAIAPQVLAARLSCEEETSYGQLREHLAGPHDAMGKHRVLGCADYVQNPMVLDAERVRQGITLDYATYLDLCDPDSPRLHKLQADALASDWLLLAQIDSIYAPDAELSWGDGGTHYFWIRRADLDARDFSHVFYDAQSG